MAFALYTHFLKNAFNPEIDVCSLPSKPGLIEDLTFWNTSIMRTNMFADEKGFASNEMAALDFVVGSTVSRFTRSTVERATSAFDAADEYIYKLEGRIRNQFELPPIVSDDDNEADEREEDNRLVMAEEGRVSRR
jgi:hypothetical protein